LQTIQAYIPFEEMNPLISFIIPVYNIQVELLRTCINSIISLALESNEREIIIIDDGSFVQYGDLIKKYDNEIIYIRKQNGGVSSARNVGIKKSSGEYIQFIDGDDMLIAKEYNHCIDILRKRKPEIVSFQFTKEIPTKRHKDIIITNTDGIELLRKHNIFSSVCCYIFKRSMISSTSFSEDIAYAEDDEFTTRVLIDSTSIIRTNIIGYYYYQNDSSAISNSNYTKKSTNKRLNDVRDVIIILNNSYACKQGPKREAISRRISQLTMNYIYLTIIMTRDRKQLRERIFELEKASLFPLPIKRFTIKYYFFAWCINHKISRYILFRLLPLLPTEQ